MNRSHLLTIILFFITVSAIAQTDTATIFLDSNAVGHQKDSINKSVSIIKVDTAKKEKNNPVLINIEENKLEASKDFLFYYILFLFFVIGVLFRSFDNYFKELFQYFFRINLKHREVREHLLLSVFPSFLTNIYFLFTVGLYVNFQLEYFDLSLNSNFWTQYVYCSFILGVVYLIKYIGLKFTAWLFGAKKIVESYMFVVFGLNKILGIIILPLLLALAFGNNLFFSIAINLTWVGIAFFYLYRIVLTYTLAQKAFRIGPLHFLIYALSFEILPLFIGYKILHSFFN